MNHLSSGIQSYVPYTLKDYKVVQSEKYYELGGLGSANIGSDDWRKKQEALLRRKNYSRLVELTNTKRLSVPAERKQLLPKPPSSREKAIEFAKNIPKPRGKPKLRVKEEPSKENQVSRLAELEQKHSNYKATIEEIRSKI